MDGSGYVTSDGRFLPRVSNILSETEPVWRKERLQMWKDKQVREGKCTNEARVIGTAVHALRSIYLLDGINPLECLSDFDHLLDPVRAYPEGEAKAIAYFEGLLPALTNWNREKHFWCEKPIDGNTKYLYTDPLTGEVGGRLWSDALGFAGCPDDIGHYLLNGAEKLVICDYKTSKRPYVTLPPNRLPLERQPKRNSKEWREFESGYEAYHKCCLQLGAYWIAAKEQFGFDADLMMLICLKDRVQRFTLTQEQKLKAVSGFKRRLQQYKSIEVKRDCKDSSSEEKISQIAEIVTH